MTDPDDALTMLQREVLEAALRVYLEEVVRAHQQAVCPWLKRHGPKLDEAKPERWKGERE